MRVVAELAVARGAGFRVAAHTGVHRDRFFLEQHFALGDVAVAPKLSDTEGAGKILNYMAMELPTVAFDTPVSREYLGALGTYAGHTGDPAALADAIAGLLDEPPQRRTELGHELRARVARHFSWDRAGRQLLAIYRSVLEPQTRKSR